GYPVPQDPAEITRCVIDSLALAYRRALADATALSGQEISLVHVVGGGSLNELLCQVTADATGLPVLAGPAEGTALGYPLAQDPAEITRCVIDSLALAYRRALADATALSGQEISLVHVVGGGSLNELLCQVTADATGLPVLAGPAEGTALGNALVQAR